MAFCRVHAPVLSSCRATPVTRTHLINFHSSSGRLAHGDGIAIQAASLLSPQMGFEANQYLTTSEQILNLLCQLHDVYEVSLAMT